MVFAPPLAIRNLRNGGVLLTPLQLASLPITVRDGAVTLKGSPLTGWGMGGFFRKISQSLSLMMTYQMSLISAGSISLTIILIVLFKIAE